MVLEPSEVLKSQLLEHLATLAASASSVNLRRNLATPTLDPNKGPVGGSDWPTPREGDSTRDTDALFRVRHSRQALARRVPGDSSGSQNADLTRIEMMHLCLAGYRGE